MQPPPIVNGKPTQLPLNRQEQKVAFEALKNTYFLQPPPVPQFPLQPIKEYKLSESEQLLATQTQMKERGMTEPLVKVEQRLEEKKTADTIKSFYCHHVFQSVSARWGVFPINYKICKKCNLVK
jgi:hypothetical protein